MLEPQIILVDKPAGVTSHDVVAFWRRELRPLNDGRLLVGHAGTLDPFATGLLIILVGQAAKAQSEFMGSSKRYQTTIKLGEQTDTGDLTGAVIATKSVPEIAPEVVRDLFGSWPAKFTQKVPAYAAAKINGRKLYEYARQGQEPAHWPIRICQASNWRLERWDQTTDELTFSVTVSAGCYIRSLGESIAAKLDTAGHLISLRRLSSGQLTAENAIDVSEYLLPALEDRGR